MSRIPTRRAAVVSYTERDDLHPAVEQRAQVVEAGHLGGGRGASGRGGFTRPRERLGLRRRRLEAGTDTIRYGWGTAVAMALLDVNDLRVEFPSRRGTLVAVDGVSLAVEPGEVLGVVGESGAGKSTVGNAVIGLLEPPGEMTAGEVRLAGRRIDDLDGAGKRRLRGKRIGMIFQDPLTSLNPLQTVERQLVETIDLHLGTGEAEGRRRAVELLRQVGIPEPELRVKQYPHQFSGGMRQRVVIALALCAEPDVIIADEPTTALDVSIQAQILDLMRALCRERSVGMMIITHDMGVIADISDRVAVMYRGRLVEHGVPLPSPPPSSSHSSEFLPPSFTHLPPASSFLLLFPIPPLPLPPSSLLLSPHSFLTPPSSSDGDFLMLVDMTPSHKTVDEEIVNKVQCTKLRAVSEDEEGKNKRDVI